MLSLSECLRDDTRIQLIKPEEVKKKKSLFHFFRQKDEEKRIFRKDFNHAELIGEELCNVRNLRCAHFFLIGEGYYRVNRTAPYSEIYGEGYQLKIASYDFRDPVEFEYFQIVDNGLRNDHDYLEELLEFVPTEENRRELLDEVEEMFALDTFMGQTDRYWNNVIFERNKETREIHLAPLYDFEYSLKSSNFDPHMMYGNVLHNFRDADDYVAFIQEHPEFAEKLRFYLNIDLIDVIERSYRAKGLRVPAHAIPFYEEFEQERKNFIRQVTGEENIRVK